MKRIILFIFALLLFLPLTVSAKDNQEITLRLFYGRECPHCEAMIEFLNDYMSKHDNVKLIKYEIWHDEANQEKMKKVINYMDIKINSIPFLVIGSNYVTGYNDNYTSDDIINKINYYKTHEFLDIAGMALGEVEEQKSNDNNTITTFNIPLIGKVEAKSVSLPLIGVLIGLVDGFNPCAMWILIFLITMMLGMKNRKRMWVLGITFLLTSALIYALFMISWLSLATFMNKIKLIKLLIAVVALVFGILNISKYFKKEDIGCEVVNDNKRKRIIKSVKKITTEKSFVIALFGIIVLAFGVNLIELFCSLGLPVLYTQILSLNDISTIKYIICITIYILFYLLDDLIVFIIAMSCLKIKAISNKYTKYSHLIGGIIMLVIGLLMIFKPEWLMFNF